MNETWLRWKARIGSLKSLAVIILIFVIALGLATFQNFWRALQNPQGTQPAGISQLVTNQIGRDRFITVSGLAAYQLSYHETENGSLTALIYPLIDEQRKDVIFVRTTRTELMDAEDAEVTVSGLTQSAPSDLRDLIQKDMADINSAGFATTDSLYIEQGREPGDVSTYLLQGLGLGLVLLLCVSTFFFPATVFHVQPLQPISAGQEVRSVTRATGLFQQLTAIEPTLEFGRTTRRFENAAANLFTVEQRWMGVYIHFVFTRRMYGVQVSKQESDWAVIVKPMQVVALEPGKLYGWRDRWAVSCRYRDANEKEQTLLIAFETSAAQATYVNYLRSKGYAVSTGEYPVTSVQSWA